jgi:hypothetical protein
MLSSLISAHFTKMRSIVTNDTNRGLMQHSSEILNCDSDKLFKTSPWTIAFYRLGLPPVIVPSIININTPYSSALIVECTMFKKSPYHMPFLLFPTALLCSGFKLSSCSWVQARSICLRSIHSIHNSTYHAWPRPPITVGTMCHRARIDVDMDTSYFNHSMNLISPERHRFVYLLVHLAVTYQCRHRSLLCTYSNPHSSAKAASNLLMYVAIRVVWMKMLATVEGWRCSTWESLLSFTKAAMREAE